MTVVYIDTLFLINLIINYLLLLASAKLTGFRANRLRLLLGALFGAFYAIIVFFPHMEPLKTVFGKVLSSLLISLIGFGWKKGVLRQILVFWAVSFAFGGCVLAVNLFSGGSFSLEHGIVYAPVSMRVLALSVGISYVIIAFVFKGVARHGGLKREITKTVVTLDGRKVEMSTLLDSGNTLTDPLTSRPVLIAEHDIIRPLIPTRLQPIIDKNAANKPVEAMENLALIGETKLFRLIPYKAVGVESGMLLALKPDNVTVGGERMKGALIAISPTKLSDGGAFNALSGI